MNNLKKIKFNFKKFKESFPLMFRKTYNEAMKRELEYRKKIFEQYAQEVEGEKIKIKEVIDNVVKLDWRYEVYGAYSLMLSFNPFLLGQGYSNSYQQKLFAEEIGKRVQREIETSKFVQKANDLENTKYRCNSFNTNPDDEVMINKKR